MSIHQAHSWVFVRSRLIKSEGLSLDVFRQGLLWCDKLEVGKIEGPNEISIDEDSDEIKLEWLKDGKFAQDLLIRQDSAETSWLKDGEICSQQLDPFPPFNIGRVHGSK